MFRIDNDFVIDATITGGPARSVCLQVMTEVREVTFKLMCVCVYIQQVHQPLMFSKLHHRGGDGGEGKQDHHQLLQTHPERRGGELHSD